MLLKNKELRRKVYVKGLLEVTLTEGYIVEEDNSKEPFDCSMTLPSSTVRTVMN